MPRCSSQWSPGIGPGTADLGRVVAWKPWRRAGRLWAPEVLEVAGSALVDDWMVGWLENDWLVVTGTWIVFFRYIGNNHPN